MKKVFISLLLMGTGALQMQAQEKEYNYLTVAYNSVEQSITLGTVQKITFANGNCVVTTSEGDFSYLLSQMEKMTFTKDPTAIKSLPEASKNLTYAKGLLTVKGDGILRIYNASGALIRMADVKKKKGTADLRSLPSGLYIITLGDETIKIRK